MIHNNYCIIIFLQQGSNTNSLSKKSEGSVSNKSDDEAEGLETEEEKVPLRNRSINFAERSSVNQCINELSSNLAAEAARRRCNSEIVQRTEKEENIGNMIVFIINYFDNIIFIEMYQI